MLLRTLSATGQRQILGAIATTSTTLQEQEGSPKIRTTGNCAGIITGAIV